MLQTDIAKYAVWLFGHSVTPGEKLPELYELLCRKNPVGSESLDYREFELLFQQWQWRQLHGDDDAAGDRPEQTAATPVIDERSAPSGAACDYHVATAFLIEELIAIVKQHLAEGWRPLGGIAQSRSGSGAGYWAQALTRTDC